MKLKEIPTVGYTILKYKITAHGQEGLRVRQTHAQRSSGAMLVSSHHIFLLFCFKIHYQY